MKTDRVTRAFVRVIPQENKNIRVITKIYQQTKYKIHIYIYIKTKETRKICFQEKLVANWSIWIAPTAVHLPSFAHKNFRRAAQFFVSSISGYCLPQHDPPSDCVGSWRVVPGKLVKVGDRRGHSQHQPVSWLVVQPVMIASNHPLITKHSLVEQKIRQEKKTPSQLNNNKK